MENSEEDEDYYGNKENEPSDEDEMEVSEKPRKIVKKDEDEDDGFDLSKFKVDEWINYNSINPYVIKLGTCMVST